DGVGGDIQKLPAEDVVFKFKLPDAPIPRHHILRPFWGSRIIGNFSHGLRRGLYSFAASRLDIQGGIMRNFVALVLVGCSALAAAQTLSPEVRAFVKVDAPLVALTHVRVIDGTGAPAWEDQTVVISKGRIESVGDAATANVPKDAQVIDLHGYSVIPGLVGMHDHMFYPVGRGVFGEMAFSFPRLYLAGGVTTIRTTGSLEPYTDLELKKSIDNG